MMIAAQQKTWQVYCSAGCRAILVRDILCKTYTIYSGVVVFCWHRDSYPMILCANKVDLVHQRKVSEEQVRELATRLRVWHNLLLHICHPSSNSARTAYTTRGALLISTNVFTKKPLSDTVPSIKFVRGLGTGIVE